MNTEDEVDFSVHIITQTPQSLSDDVKRAFQAVSKSPHDPAAHYELGVAYVAQGNDGMAIKELREAVRLKPDYADAFIDLGIALSGDCDWEGALDCWKKAVFADPEATDARLLLGKALVFQGKRAEARRQWEIVLTIIKEEYPDDTDAELMRLQDVRDAKQLLEKYPLMS